jgi:hypothetical protein
MSIARCLNADRERHATLARAALIEASAWRYKRFISVGYCLHPGDDMIALIMLYLVGCDEGVVK